MGARMFHIHLGDTPHNMKEADFKKLGDMSDGYSGSDISTVVREALMEPLRQCQIATAFKLVDGKYMPCKPGDRGAEKKTLMDLDPEKLRCPDVSFDHFKRILDRGGGATVAKEELQQFEDWTEEFGQEGA